MENENKVLNINFYETCREWDDCTIQRCWSDDVECLDYRVQDLTECPEDATVYRDLFSAQEYIEAIKLGMELAQKGYTNIVINTVDKDRYE